MPPESKATTLFAKIKLLVTRSKEMPPPWSLPEGPGAELPTMVLFITTILPGIVSAMISQKIPPPLGRDLAAGQIGGGIKARPKHRHKDLLSGHFSPRRFPASGLVPAQRFGIHPATRQEMKWLNLRMNRVRAALDLPTTEVPPPRIEAQPLAPTASGKILVVDDNAVILETLSMK